MRRSRRHAGGEVGDCCAGDSYPLRVSARQQHDAMGGVAHRACLEIVLRAPRICVSSPRITPGSAEFTMRPGTMCTVGPAWVRTGVRTRTFAARSVGTVRYSASTHPWFLPTMPQAITGSPGTLPSHSPHSASKARPKATLYGVPDAQIG